MRALALSVIAVLHLTLAVAVWRARPENRVNRFFAIHTLTVVAWTIGIAWIQSGLWLQAGANLTFASAGLIPPTLLMFTIHYPSATKTSWGIPQTLALVVGGFFALTAFTTNWLAYNAHWNGSAMSRQAGVLYPWFAAYFVVVLGAALAVFVRKWRFAKGRERIQLNYYGAGLLVAAIGGMTANLIIPATTGSSSLSHLGPYFGLVLIALTAHATVRHRFVDLRVVIRRGLTFGIAMTFSLIPVLVLLVLIRRSILLHFTFVETLLIGGAFLAVALLIPVTGDVAERLIDRYVYRVRANPQRLLRQASSELTHALDLDRLLRVIGNTIRATAEPHGVAIYLNRDGALRLSVADIVTDDEFRAPSEPAAPIVHEAIARAIPLLRDELEVPGDAALREALTIEGWALALPLFADQQIVGLIAVGPKRSGDPFFSDDIDAFATLANHAGTAVRNARLYAEVVLANEYVNHIVVAMQNGVVVLDASGTVTLVNPAARDLLQLPSEALLKVDDLPPPLRSIVEEVLRDDRERIASRDVTLPQGEASSRSLLCTASQLPARGSDRAGAVIVFSDVTPLRELDKQRARAENLTNLQRLTQALAHEIGNPLVPIKTLTKLLPERVGDHAFAEKVSRIVSREIERIEHLVARLRRVAPSAGANYSLTDLRIPIRHALEVIEATAAEQGTSLESDLPESSILVLGDSAEIEELFLNLLTNALEAVAELPVGSRCVWALVKVDDHNAIVQIRDSGHGIPTDVVDRIFDPFVTTKSRGSGLGLAICRGIVERHRGRLSAANADDGGAVFTVTLRAVADEGLASPM